jgi:hypothetical protein
MGRRDPDRPTYYQHLAIAVSDLLVGRAFHPAQDNYEIQVYGSDRVDPGHTMIELHNNFTIEGSATIVDGVYPMNRVEHETAENTHRDRR